MHAIFSDIEPSRFTTKTNPICLVEQPLTRLFPMTSSDSSRKFPVKNPPTTRLLSQHARSDLHVVVKNRKATSFKRPTMLPVEEAHGVDAQIGKVAAHLVVHGHDHGRCNGCMSTSVEGPGAPRGSTLFVPANSPAGSQRWHCPRLHQGRGVLGRVALARRAVAGGLANPQASVLHCSKGFSRKRHHGAAAALYLLHVKHHALAACRCHATKEEMAVTFATAAQTQNLVRRNCTTLKKNIQEHRCNSGCTTNRWPATRSRGTARHRSLLQRQCSQREHPPTQQRMRPSSSWTWINEMTTLSSNDCRTRSSRRFHVKQLSIVCCWNIAKTLLQIVHQHVRVDARA